MLGRSELEPGSADEKRQAANDKKLRLPAVPVRYRRGDKGAEERRRREGNEKHDGLISLFALSRSSHQYR